jgi:hypothetical protein
MSLAACCCAVLSCRSPSGDAATKEPPAPPAAAAPASVASTSASEGAAAPACEPLHVDVPAMTMVGDDPPVPPIEDAHGELDPFFLRLAAMVRGKTKDPVRIGVYGDSNGTMDFMTGRMRRVLQERYGDAGHGFYAVGQPWNWYRHQDVVKVLQLDTWESATVTTHPTQDRIDGKGWYGHSMITAQSKQGGAKVWLSTAPADAGAPVGNTVSHFEVWYLRWPHGGHFDVEIDGEHKATIDTHCDTPEAGFATFDLPDAPHKFTLVAKESPTPVRFLGVTFERTGVGSVQVDGLGVGSLNCLGFLRDDPVTNKATLARRAYDLVLFHVGTNTFFGDLGACMKKVFARHRDALPSASYLVMSPPDELEGIAKPYKSAASVIATSDALHRVAADEGAAWFDFRAAMGGDGSMGRFHDLDMSGEYVHFNDKGGAYMGDRVVYALWTAFQAWAAAHPRAGCD